MVPLLDRVSSRARSTALLVGGVALGVGVAVGASALAGDDGAAAPAAFGRPAAPEGSAPLLDPSRLAEVEGPRERAASPAEAVERFLEAEQSGDYERSFGYLADAVRLDYGSPAAWAADHPDALPPVTGFSVESASPSDAPTAQVMTVTRYESSLDSVVGLVPARAQTAWATVREEGGWAVDPTATTQTPLLPPDEQATAAVQAWAERLQDCGGIEELTRSLRGRVDLAEQLCRAPGAVRAGAAGPLPQFEAAPLQSSFGADVVSWARVVPVEGAAPLRAVVAPVDDAWSVVGVLGPPGAGG